VPELEVDRMGSDIQWMVLMLMVLKFQVMLQNL
jgi:hypothetical protein